MVRDILKKLKPAELRKYISAHNKVIRQYIGVEIKQARVAYSEKLKVKRREMKAAQEINAKGKKKDELIELIMKEPTLVRKVKFDDENKKVDPPAPAPKKQVKKPVAKKPKIPTIKISQRIDVESDDEEPKKEIKSSLPPIPKPKIKIRVAPKKKPEPKKPKKLTAEQVKAAAIKAAEEAETESEDEGPAPPIKAVPRRLHSVWKVYMEERVGDYYSAADQQEEIDELKLAEKNYFESEKIRTNKSSSASQQAKARNANARLREDMDKEFKADEDIKKIYKEFAPKLLKAYIQFQKDGKQTEEQAQRAKKAKAKEQEKFEKDLKKKEEEAEKEEAEIQKRIAKASKKPKAKK
jgi:hypothetical protein